MTNDDDDDDDDNDVDVGAGAGAAAVSTADGVDTPEIVKLPMKKLCSCENTDCNENICINRETLDVTLSLPTVADLQNVKNDTVELLQIPIDDSNNNKILISMNVNQVISSIEDKEPIDENINNNNNNNNNSSKKPSVKTIEILPKGSIKFTKKIPVKKRSQDEDEIIDNDENTKPLCNNLTKIKLANNENINNYLSNEKLNNDDDNDNNKLIIENEENQNNRKINKCNLLLLDDGRQSMCSKTSALSEKALSVDLEKLTPNIIEHYQRKLSNNSIDTTNKIQAERCISTNSSVATDKTLLTSPNKNNHQNNNNSSNNTSSKVKRFSPIRFDKSPVLKKVVLKRNETVKLHLEPKKLILENNSVDDNNNKQSIINNNVAGSQIINNNTNEKIDLSVKRKIEVEEKLPSPKRFKFDRKRQKEDDDDDDEEGSSKSSLNKIKINLSDKSTSKSPIAKTTTINSKTHDDFIMKWLNKDIDNSVSENNNTTIDNDKTIITNENKSVSPKLTKNNLQIYTKNDNSIKLKQNDNISVEKTQLIDEVLDYNQDNDDDLSIDGLKLTEKSVGSTKVIDNLSETGNKKLPSSSSSSSSSSTSSSSNHSCSVTDCSCNNGPTTKLKNNNNNNNKMSFDGNITDTEDLQMSEKFDVKSVKEKLNNQDNHDDEISLFGGDIDDIETEENNNDMDVDVDDNNNNNNNNSKNIKINKNMSSLSIATMSNNSNNSNDNNDDGDYKKMHSNNIDPFIEYNNIEFNQIFDEYESNSKQKNNTKSPINDNNNNNNNNKNRKLITYDYNLNIKKTQINEYPPGIIKKFNGYCFGMLKYARCNNIDRCRFEHTLKPRDEFLNDEQSYVIKLRIEYAIFRGWHFYITHVYENAIKKMDSAKIILELYNDIINKFIDDKNEPVYGLLGPTVIELAERKMPPSHIVNALIKTINNNDTYKPRIIIKKIKNYIENGNYWVTLRELIIMLPQPPDEIIIPILNECILGKATVEQILDVEKNMIQKLSAQVISNIDQSLIRNWCLLLKNIDDKYQLNNNNTNNNNNNNEKSIVPTIESPSSSTATVQQVHVTPMLTGIKKRLGKLDKLLNNDKNNNNNNHNDNVDDNDNDNVIDDINIIENNINDDDNDNQEYEIDTVDNVSKPVCIYQNQLFNFHHNLQIIRNELKKKNYKAVIQILNDVKFNTNELSPFARGFYAILCKEIMPATHHLAEIIHLSVHKGNDVVKLLNLLVKVGNYLLVKLADTGAMGLAYQLVKTLQPYRIELSTSHIILTIEIYIANRHLLKALDLVKQHNLIFVRRSKMKPEEYAKLEYLRRPLINLLLKSLCKDYPKEAFYLFERLLKEQSSCCEPIDLRKHVHDVVASLVRHNHDEQLMTMGLLILKHKVPIFTPTLRVFVIKLFYINRYVAHQMYSYAIGLGAYSIIKVGTFTTMVIHTQWNEEEIYLRIHDLLENISNKLWHLIERPGPKEFSVYLTIEIVPSEFSKQTHIECNKNIIDDTKLKLVEVLDKFEPKIKMIEINERIFKILDYSIVNYVKSNHSLL